MKNVVKKLLILGVITCSLLISIISPINNDYGIEACGEMLYKETNY